MLNNGQLELLFELAAETAHAEARRSADGEGVAAAARTRAGSQLTGVWIDAMVDSACLCAETGPVCEAQRTKDPIVASVCVRWTEPTGPVVLPPCGICQERLAVFGTDVLVAVSRDGETTEFRPLAAMRPFSGDDRLQQGGGQS